MSKVVFVSAEPRSGWWMKVQREDGETGKSFEKWLSDLEMAQIPAASGKVAPKVTPTRKPAAKSGSNGKAPAKAAAK